MCPRLETCTVRGEKWQDKESKLKCVEGKDGLGSGKGGRQLGMETIKKIKVGNTKRGNVQLLLVSCVCHINRKR